jgi:Zn-dependent protease with chaperone function
MISYVFLDFILGISVGTLLKNCKNYKRLKNFEFLDHIFKESKQIFGIKNVKLYISNSSEINAFAVGSMRKKAVILTKGIINHAMNNSKNDEEFLRIIRSIIGHEMSHLINKDYLPGLIIMTNQKVTNFVSRIIRLIIVTPITIIGYVRIRSRIYLDIALFIYNIVNNLVIFFNNKIISNIYEFIRRFISRSIEYRCDRQSAQAFGGGDMALSLSLFGSNGYFTLFSTHPNTKSRIKKVKKISFNKRRIRPLISSSISNYLSFLVLIIICSVSMKNSGVDLWLRYYLENSKQFIN